VASPEPFRRLKEETGKLEGLYQDVHAPVFARQDWKSNVFARRTLGDGVPVEAWFLAEYFLLTWNDWHGLRRRYLAYFGQPERRFPRNWNTLHMRCKGLAEQILRDAQLDEIVHDSWVRGADIDPLFGGQKEPTPRALYHALITNHRRLDLLLWASTWEEGGPGAKTERAPSGNPVWPRCRHEVGQLNRRLLSLWPEWSRGVREACLWHVRQYRRGNLLVSWLVNPATADTEDDSSALFRVGGGSVGGGGFGGVGGGFGGGVGGCQPDPDIVQGRSALLHVLRERIVIPSIEQYLGQLKDTDLRGTASRVLERIAGAIAEIGYDEFVEDVTSSDFKGGSDSLVGASAINLIPSKTNGHCQPLLLAVSKGDKKAIGFPSVMRKVREHLIRCPTTLSVIVLCDHWAPDMLDEHWGDLRAHHDRGVRFLFLMVGTLGRVIAPVAVDLSLAP
jgi:hypothetical protein